MFQLIKVFFRLCLDLQLHPANHYPDSITSSFNENSILKIIIPQSLLKNRIAVSLINFPISF